MVPLLQRLLLPPLPWLEVLPCWQSSGEDGGGEMGKPGTAKTASKGVDGAPPALTCFLC